MFDCPRLGGGVLTIRGTGFGFVGAAVLIGSSACPLYSLQLDSVLTCTLPAGAVPNAPVLVVQNGGALNANVASLGYQQCEPGPQSLA